jgi:endoglucanase
MRGPRERGTATTALILGTVVALLLTVGPASAEVTGKLAPTGATLFGAYVKPTTGYDQSDVKNAINRREQQLGRRFDISQQYYRWGKVFPGWKEQWDLQMGRIPLIGWDGPTTSSINSGTHDGYIRARADGVRRLGAPVFIRWFSEMDANFHAQEAGTPAAYISAWRRIHRIFKNRGATNVVWVWCGTAAGFKTGKAQSYYPGDAYVDWTCADGFNWAPRRAGSTWTSFGEIFRAFYAWGSTKGKPMMIAETGTEEDYVPGRKGDWVKNAAHTIKNQMSDIKAFVYFDSKRTDFGGTTYDWRMDTSPGSMNAFATMGRDPHFRWNRSYRPDALVKGRKGGFVGEDVYGQPQVAKGRLRKRAGAVFTVRLENDGNIGDVFLLKPETSAKRMKITYRVNGRDVTGQVRGGSFLTEELQPGEATTIDIQVRAKRGRKVIHLSVISGSDRTKVDTVTASVRGKKRR